jgi:dolichol-phosphate mannosyltransferase
MKLSIIIPVYNEEKTVCHVLEKVERVDLDRVTKQIIIIDDGSTDGTLKEIEKFQFSHKSIKVFGNKNNSGKGSAVILGLKHASGDYVIIQDADLEYDPEDIRKLIEPVQDKKAEVVYGTRLKRLPRLSRDERTPQFFIHYIGNKFLSFLTSILYGQWITDMETCYKLFPKKSLESVKLYAKGFEFEPEITANLMKKGYAIKEIPITTTPRGYKDGKKLNTIRDGLIALWTLVKYRFQK